MVTTLMKKAVVSCSGDSALLRAPFLFVLPCLLGNVKTSVQMFLPGHCGDLNVRCLNGTCLTLRDRCDGVAQCSDGRDEPVTCGMVASFVSFRTLFLS